MKKRVFLGKATFRSVRVQFSAPDGDQFEYMGVEFFCSELMEPYDIFSTDAELKAYVEGITPNRPPVINLNKNGTIDADHGVDIWEPRK